MRLVDVVLASVLVGLVLGFLHVGIPGARADAKREAFAGECSQSACHRLTWLRAPLLRRTGHGE